LIFLPGDWLLSRHQRFPTVFHHVLGKWVG
jgi:hypothetical protein